MKAGVEPAPTGSPTSFWTRNQPGFRFSDAEPGSSEFFSDIERHRYSLEPHIPEIARFEDWSDRDVLEVGCGVATDGVRFARAGARYTGVDPTESARRLAERRFELEAVEGSFLAASATALPFADASFDLVYSHGVIHHIDDTEGAVEEFRRVLRPGGTALVMLYHRNSLNYHLTIMVVRRMLAGLLLTPGVDRAVARLAGERPEVLAGHRELLRRHGIAYLSDRELFLSNNTDGPGNPLSKVYSRREARELFSRFAAVETAVRFLNLRIYPAGDRIAATSLARGLERRIGWHLYVRATKGEAVGSSATGAP